MTDTPDTPELRHTPLGDCGMPRTIADSLRRRGLRTVGDLLDASWTMLLYQTPYLGPKRASMLLSWMEYEGLVMRPQRSLDPAVRERSAADCDARYRQAGDYAWRGSRYQPDPPSAASERDRQRVENLGWAP